MILRKKCFYDARPNQKRGESTRERNQIGRNRAESRAQSLSSSTSNQCFCNQKTSLTSDEDRRNFNNTMRHQPSKQKFCFAGKNVIQTNCTENHTVVKKENHHTDAES